MLEYYLFFIDLVCVVQQVCIVYLGIGVIDDEVVGYFMGGEFVVLEQVQCYWVVGEFVVVLCVVMVEFGVVNIVGWQVGGYLLVWCGGVGYQF